MKRQFIEKYLPEHLKKKPGVIAKTLKRLAKNFIKFDTEGRDNLPEDEACLMVSNHFGDEGGALLALEGRNVHVSLGERIWWKRSPMHRWLFKKMGAVPIKESLANLTPEEQEEAKANQDKYGQKVFQEIMDEDAAGNEPDNREFLRAAVAALLNGDDVSIFPEGLWKDQEGSTMMKARRKQELYEGYEGMEAIARLYKKISGKDLFIAPVALDENRETGKQAMRIGKVLQGKDTHEVMTEIARMLPEDQRGHYRKMAEEAEETLQ